MPQIPGSLPMSSNWFAGSSKVTQALSPDAVNLLKNSMGFKGVKIVTVQEGMQGLAIKDVIRELGKEDAKNISKEISEILRFDVEKLESVLVVVGGLELIKSRFEEIKKSLKKIDKEKISKLAKELGLLTDQDVLIIAEDGTNIETGGLIFIHAGLKEIEESISNK
jgi:hypothetical protein